MLNIIWPLFLIISFVFSILKGTLPETNSAIFEAVQNAIDLSITLLGTMCLWCGIIKIAMTTRIINKLKIIFKPILEYLFPDVNPKSKAYEEISMNIIANLFGLGNAATPLGLKAMKSLQEENIEKNKLSNSMALLIVLNTASIQIIPTTVIAIRNSLASKNPTQMIFPVWIATALAAIFAILSAKILSKKW